MASPRLVFTSESVTEGHPDKICDQVSDAVLDACLAEDPRSRVACETAVKTGYVMLMGEVTTRAHVNYDKLVREVVTGIGFDDSAKGFDGNTCGVLVAIMQQSADIALGVDKALEAKSGQMTDAEVEAKFREFCGSHLGERGCDAVLKAVWNLEQAADVGRDVVALLAAAK